MHLAIQNLLPVYFEEDRKSGSDIWGKELRFDKGEYIKIVAPSGSGKTSLILFLYGTRNDYSGTISYDDKSIQRFTPETFSGYRKNNVSVVFQDLRLFPDLTVRDNIEIKRVLNPYYEAEKITEMAGRLGIANKLNSKCNTCSYGEQQRVAIIRALVQPFDFLLLDEPFSHLDNENAQKAMQLMEEESKKRGAAIIFANLERTDYFHFTRLLHL